MRSMVWPSLLLQRGWCWTKQTTNCYNAFDVRVYCLAYLLGLSHRATIGIETRGCQGWLCWIPCLGEVGLGLRHAFVGMRLGAKAGGYLQRGTIARGTRKHGSLGHV